jgi:DNA-binding NarL/FixJ family response regulator
MIRVVIVDDHAVVRLGVERALAGLHDVEVVATAANGVEALRATAEHLPDVILMDIEMPGEMDGIEATLQIRRLHPDVRIVILTSHLDRGKIEAALQAGANGYTLKDGDLDELERAVRVAVDGDYPISPKAARMLLERRPPATLAKPALSQREHDVLALAARGYANKEIARSLWITERTVKGHFTRIFRKIGVTDRTQAALWAQRNSLAEPQSRSES